MVLGILTALQFTVSAVNTEAVVTASQQDDIVNIAQSQIGVKERSSGSDDIFYNDWYYGRRVNNNGVAAKYAWCAVFVSWCADQAGISTSIIPKTAGTTYMKDNINGTPHLKGSGYTPQHGDIIFFGSNASQHVGIVDYASGNTVYYIDGNNTQTDPHGVHYSSCSLSYSSLWGFVSPNYEKNNHNPIGAWDSIITGGMKRIRVTGWTYDLDDPNASLDIHVYVGGPAGSGAPCYVIKADVYRTDINIGNCRHGFDSFIDVSPTGRQNVYLYAINVGEGQYTELGMKTIDIEGEIASFGYDYPTDNQDITGRTFLFQGWVQANKEIASITCSINDGEKYVTSNLYTRPDVPNATAFRADISTSKLNVGNNKIAVCVNFTDGTGVVAGVRTINRTRPTIIAAVDCPVEGQHIDEDTFLFQGWVDADKEIDSITVRINNGAYYNLGLYNREDVPYATAFRREFSSDYLEYGDNSFALCVNYKDGTGAVPVIRNFVKDYEVAVDNPMNNEVISSEKFLVQGWAVANKEIKSVECLINGEKYKEAGLYKREDVPFATAFRREIFTNELSVGENTIAIVVEYTDGTSITARERTVIREYLEPTTSPTEPPTTLPTESPTVVNNLLGDADGDGDISILDATIIQRYLAEFDVPHPEITEVLGDVTGDGLDIIDATLIQRYLAEFTVNYPIGEPIT